MTSYSLALITGGFTLGAVIVTFGGNQLAERLRDRREARRARSAAVRELMTATVDLVSGIQIIRGAYGGQSSWRMRLKIVATVFAAACSVFASVGDISLKALLDWRSSGSLIDRLLVADRQLDESQRTTALDMATVVVPRTARFYAALAGITLAQDDSLAEAAGELADAVGPLIEAIGTRQRTYDRKRQRVEKALAEFRSAARQNNSGD